MERTTAIFEILLMLLVAAVFGFVFAWILNRNKSNNATTLNDSSAEEIEKLKKKNNDFLLQLGNVKRSNIDLSIKLDECNKRGQAMKAPLNMVALAPEIAEENTKQVSEKINKQDDLKIIEGIGPKIEELLYNAGIKTFSHLADADVSDLKQILVNAGTRYQMHDPSTWTKQSELARDGKLDELKILQDELNAGRI